MYPIVFTIGAFTIYTYGVLVAVGFVAGYFLTLRMARKDGLSEKTVADLVWVCLLGGLVGARLLYVAFNFSVYRAAPFDVLKIWQGGLVWFGGLIGACIVGVFFLRRWQASIPLFADALAPGLALGQAIGRLGCFAAGCCYGRITDLPWSVVFRSSNSLAPTDLPLHPAQIYESVLALALCLGLIVAKKRVKDFFGAGALALIYLGAYSLIRLAVEFFRGDDRGPAFLSITSTGWVAIVLLAAAVIGIAGLVVRNRKSANT